MPNPSLKTDEFYNALYQRARWDYSDRLTQIEDLYTKSTLNTRPLQNTFSSSLLATQMNSLALTVRIK